MAELGFRTVNEMIGQSQMLQTRNIDDADWKLKYRKSSTNIIQRT
jgi:glutamate synthase (NADPH/NADH) large chain